MIKETPRTHTVQKESEYPMITIDEPIDEAYYEEKQEDNKLPQERTSYFFIELLICSLLLWSLLFVKGTNYGTQLTTMVKHTLQQEEIQNQTVQEVIKELEAALKQVF